MYQYNMGMCRGGGRGKKVRESNRERRDEGGEEVREARRERMITIIIVIISEGLE